MHTTSKTKLLFVALALVSLVPLQAFASCDTAERTAFRNQCASDRDGSNPNLFCPDPDRYDSTAACDSSISCSDEVSDWDSWAQCGICSESQGALMSIAHAMPLSDPGLGNENALYNAAFITGAEEVAGMAGWRYGPVCARQSWLAQFNMLRAAWATRDASEQAVYGQIDQCVRDWRARYMPDPVSQFLTAYNAQVVASNEREAPNYQSCSCPVRLPGGVRFVVKASETGDSQAKYVTANGSGNFRLSTFSAYHSYSKGNNGLPGEPFRGQDHAHFRIAGVIPELDNLTVGVVTTEAGVAKTRHTFCQIEVKGTAHRDGHSCFAPGTKIRMADGSQKKIESIVVGDRVQNPLTKQAVKVTQLVAGPENTPLVDISFGEQTLRVSQRHPMLVSNEDDLALAGMGMYRVALSTPPSTSRAKGFSSDSFQVVTAGDIAVGSMVITEDGTAKEVTSYRVLPVEEDQIVYNLAIDGADGSLEQHVVEADGFATGDYRVQQDVNRHLSN